MRQAAAAVNRVSHRLAAPLPGDGGDFQLWPGITLSRPMRLAV
jgi:hypothetical protein